MEGCSKSLLSLISFRNKLSRNMLLSSISGYIITGQTFSNEQEWDKRSWRKLEHTNGQTFTLWVMHSECWGGEVWPWYVRKSSQLRWGLSFTFRPLFQGEIRISKHASYQSREWTHGYYLTCRIRTKTWHREARGAERQRTEENAGDKPSPRSLETLELLWELHFRLRVKISRRQTATLSALSFQQLTNPDNIIEYAPCSYVTLPWMWIMLIHRSNLIFVLFASDWGGRVWLHRADWNDIIQLFQWRLGEKERRGQYEDIYTWKHRQPSSVIGDPNRITRQARILPSIFKSYIGQVENFYLLICGVNTCGLGRGRRGGRGKERGRRKRRNGDKSKRKREKNETHRTKKENRGAGWRPSLRFHLEQRIGSIGSFHGRRGGFMIKDKDRAQYTTKTWGNRINSPK